MPERVTGTVKWFNDEKGWGFIGSHLGDAFVHQSQVRKEGYRTLALGERVSFLMTQTDRGPQATDVQPLGPEAPAA